MIIKKEVVKSYTLELSENEFRIIYLSLALTPKAKLVTSAEEHSLKIIVDDDEDFTLYEQFADVVYDEN